eukprot:2023331-Pleurochrysis_carterae.AAC.1
MGGGGVQGGREAKGGRGREQKRKEWKRGKEGGVWWAGKDVGRERRSKEFRRGGDGRKGGKEEEGREHFVPTAQSVSFQCAWSKLFHSSWAGLQARRDHRPD